MYHADFSQYYFTYREKIEHQQDSWIFLSVQYCHEIFEEVVTMSAHWSPVPGHTSQRIPWIQLTYNCIKKLYAAGNSLGGNTDFRILHRTAHQNTAISCIMAGEMRGRIPIADPLSGTKMVNQSSFMVVFVVMCCWLFFTVTSLIFQKKWFMGQRFFIRSNYLLSK